MAGPGAGCGWLTLGALIVLPLLAYWCGGSELLGQLLGWLFG